MEWSSRVTSFAPLILFAGLAGAGSVDINKADAETLAAALSGVGQAKADAIVAYRERNGAFRQAADLMAVKGIGQRIIDMNQGVIRIGDAPGGE
ncbi:MAG: helix-hairpin-helix domain-containing protein [Gammaproteobacteria bacterium]|nr:helix-hairpin-helix domain-containing protein [Gammaproteobacteria bacterium]